MIIDLATFTLLHVVLSLLGIGAGFVVVYGFFTAKRLEAWTAVFLATTILTSVTGFFFPIERFTPALGTGILSLLVLTVAVAARYRFRLARRWRAAYVVSAMIALYLNVFVLVVQLYQKVPALAALAPTQTEPAFLATQLLVLLLFVALTISSLLRFRERPVGSQEVQNSALNRAEHALPSTRNTR
jgi:hypothetical protein